MSGLRRFLKTRWKQWAEWSLMQTRLSRYIRKRKAQFALALTFGLAYTTAGLLQPWVLKFVLDNVLLDHPLPPVLAALIPAGDRLLLLNVLTIGLVLLAIAGGLFYYYQRLLAARVGQQVTADIRLDLYTHLQRLSFTFHDRRRTGDILARLTSDIRLLRQIFISLPLAITSELFLVLGMLIVMFSMDWSLTLLALLVVPPIFFILHSYQRPMKRAIRKQRDREGDIATIASEVLGAIKVVQGFQREDYEVDRFSTQNKRSLRTGLKAARLEAKLRWYAEIAVAVVTALVVAVAARRVLAGTLSPGDLLVFVSYLRTFNRPLRRVSSMAERAARGTVAADRVLQMLETEITVRDRRGAIDAPPLTGEIAFERVSFSHRRRVPVLEEVDLRIRAGERVALVGPTGSGKSTLASLIPRFYDPTSGCVRIDGRDIRDFTLRSLRGAVSIVFQEPVLFGTTIAENIGYGRPEATRDEILDAAKRAGIHHKIAELAEGYDTVLGERGATLSGGQRQCVAIARAIIKDSPIVILDEPTAGLDAESSSLVLTALQNLMAGKTVILISHDLPAVGDVDRIIVLEGGRVVEEGSPSELFAREGTYHRLRRFGAHDWNP